VGANVSVDPTAAIFREGSLHTVTGSRNTEGEILSFTEVRIPYHPIVMVFTVHSTIPRL
jgi:hypothetical protein